MWLRNRNKFKCIIINYLNIFTITSNNITLNSWRYEKENHVLLIKILISQHSWCLVVFLYSHFNWYLYISEKLQLACHSRIPWLLTRILWSWFLFYQNNYRLLIRYFKHFNDIDYFIFSFLIWWNTEMYYFVLIVIEILDFRL